MVEQKESTRDSRGRFLPGKVPEGAMPWQLGQSGCPTGRPVDSVTTLLKEKDRKPVADKLYELALKGDLKAIDVFLDRTEGKVTEKHLNVNVTTTPESLQEAQQRLLSAKEGTKGLLDRYPHRITNATK